MTKQDFLNGVEFTINGIGNYKYKASKDEGITEGSLHRIYRTQKNNRIILTDYEANISKVSNNSFTFYTMIVGQTIEKRVMFNKLTVADVTEIE